MKKQVNLAVEPHVFKKTKFVRRVSYNKSYWLYRNQYFFKFATSEQNETGPIVSEILVSRLCKELGVECAEYGYGINLHKNYEHRGVISKSFLKEGEKSITLGSIREAEILKQFEPNLYLKMMVIFARCCPITMLTRYKDLHTIAHNLIYKYENKSKLLLPVDRSFIKNNMDVLRQIEQEAKTEKFLTVDECERRIALFAKEKGLKVVGNPRLGLQKIAIVDALTRQVDRHAGNISLIYDEKKKTARLAPMYDNGLCEYFGIHTPVLDYPLELNCYIKLTEKDYSEINNKETEISKFYQKVCDFCDSGKLDIFLEGLKEEFAIIDSFRTKKLDQKLGHLIRREKDNYYWTVAKRNYEKGIAYIDKNLKSQNAYTEFISDENGNVKKSFQK